MYIILPFNCPASFDSDKGFFAYMTGGGGRPPPLKVFISFKRKLYIRNTIYKSINNNNFQKYFFENTVILKFLIVPLLLGILPHNIKGLNSLPPALPNPPPSTKGLKNA